MTMPAYAHDTIAPVTSSLTAPAARPVVAWAAAALPPGEQARMVVRDLPGSAFMLEVSRR
jgi:hypothetical protein